MLTQVTEARAKVGSINVNADDPASLAQFQEAQGELQSALGRLLVVTENYPHLKADQNFLRTAGAAGRHREPHHRRARSATSARCRTTTPYPPVPENLTAMMFGYKTKPNFTVENERRSRKRRRSISASRRSSRGRSSPPQPATAPTSS